MICRLAAIVVCTLACSIASGADPEPQTWRVVSIHDGDCVTVLDAGNRQTKLRLTGIDAPELKQPFGSKARDHLAGMVMGKVIEIEDHGPDRYGRTLARIEVKGQDVNRAMT
jgi:endonuclease YncB( thermonuclease family)